jgi:transposase
LHHELGLTSRQISRSCGVARPTVAKYLSRASEAGIGWPLPEAMDEEQLYGLLFPESAPVRGGSRPLPDMEYIHRELRRRHVTTPYCMLNAVFWECCGTA